MFLAHAVAVVRQAQGKRGHVKTGAGREGSLAQVVEGLPAQLQLRVIIGKIFVHHLQREEIVTGRHRRVGRENAGGFDVLERRIEFHTGHQPLPETLQQGKSRMPLVHVQDGMLYPQGPQHFAAAYA